MIDGATTDTNACTDEVMDLTHPAGVPVWVRGWRPYRQTNGDTHLANAVDSRSRQAKPAPKG